MPWLEFQEAGTSGQTLLAPGKVVEINECGQDYLQGAVGVGGPTGSRDLEALHDRPEGGQDQPSAIGQPEAAFRCRCPGPAGRRSFPL